MIMCIVIWTGGLPNKSLFSFNIVLYLYNYINNKL
jgi:hypothetical protein